ncbi:MarR family transcriptional regulator [Streptomyces sp. NPDC101213]|uniref:MarR family transcriptional regulator n=1 Tax=Streptomyces sp. NPDC101213 TaxID=3366130 RepID=UPI003802A8C8
MSDTSASSGGTDRTASGPAACLPALHRALDRRVASACPHPKPPGGQLPLPGFVARHEGTTVREAADALLMKPDDVSVLVSRTTGPGMLERRQDSTDGRVARRYPTATSRRRLAEVRGLETGCLSEARSP